MERELSRWEEEEVMKTKYERALRLRLQHFHLPVTNGIILSESEGAEEGKSSVFNGPCLPLPVATVWPSIDPRTSFLRSIPA